MPVHYVRDFSLAMDGPKQSDDHRDGHQANNKNYQVMQNLFPAREEKNGLIREVGSVATWSLSSSKAGFGVDQLRDESMDTFWQSDGPQPHLVNITFARKTTIKYVCLYIDYNADESYTPYKLSIRAGNCFTDLQEVEQVEMDKPSGWVVITLRDGNDMPIRAFHLQIAILGNHQNGRDTHLRHVKVYSPANNTNISALGHMENDFSTTCLAQHSVLR